MKEKWYYRTSVLIIALLSVGALALPLLWFNPKFSLKNKIIISIIALVGTYFLFIWTRDALKSLNEYQESMFYQYLR